MNNTLLIIICLSLIALILLGGVRLFYLRFLKSYDEEINAYLASQHLTFAEKRKPKKEDWDTSPFERPSNFQFRTNTLKIFGIYIDPKDAAYYIIETQEKQRIWFKLETYFLAAPELSFEGLEGVSS